MQAEKRARKRFAPDKPQDCAFCYFWHSGKKRCTKAACYYLLPDVEVSGQKEGDCRNCPYGRNTPCIGYCLQKILLELRSRKSGDKERR